MKIFTLKPLLVGVRFTKEALCTFGMSTPLGSRELMDAGSHHGSAAGVRCRLGDPGAFAVSLVHGQFLFPHSKACVLLCLACVFHCGASCNILSVCHFNSHFCRFTKFCREIL